MSPVSPTFVPAVEVEDDRTKVWFELDRPSGVSSGADKPFFVDQISPPDGTEPSVGEVRSPIEMTNPPLRPLDRSPSGEGCTS